MGNEGSKLGISAMAVVSGIEKENILALQLAFKRIADNTGSTILSRSDFDKALTSVESIQRSDSEILDRLFILMDKNGDSEVDAKLFTISIAALISGSASEKLSFAFSLSDQGHSGSISASDMKKVLLALNDVASFFGDPVVGKDQITDMVREIFETHNSGGSIKYNEIMQHIVDHHLMVAFMSGHGTERYGR
jgi:Ca2+-binding EF-hand superfamily protein